MRFNTTLLAWVVLVLVVVFTPVGDMLLAMVDTIGTTVVDVLRTDLAGLLRAIGASVLAMLAITYLVHIGPKVWDRLVGPRTEVGRLLMLCHDGTDHMNSYASKVAQIAGAPEASHHQNRGEYRKALRAWEESLGLDGLAYTAFLAEEGSVLMVCLGCLGYAKVASPALGTQEVVERFEVGHGCKEMQP